MVEEDEFLVVGPLVFLAEPFEPGSGPTKFLRIRTESGRELIPVFTDLDLAARFVASHALDMDAFTLTTSALQLEYLEMLQREGCSSVSIDPGEHHARRIDIGSLIDGIRNNPR